MVAIPLTILALAAGVALLIQVQKAALTSMYRNLSWLVIILSLLCMLGGVVRGIQHMRHTRMELRMSTQSDMCPETMDHKGMEPGSGCCPHMMGGNGCNMKAGNCDHQSCDDGHTGSCPMGGDKCSGMGADGSKKCEGGKAACCMSTAAKDSTVHK